MIQIKKPPVKNVGNLTAGLTKELLLALASGILVATKVAGHSGVGYVLSEADNDIFPLFKKRRIIEALKRFETQGYVNWKIKNGKTVLILEDKGKKRVLSYELHNLKVKKPKVWDGLFRVVVFDIPETKKQARDILRKKLRELEFKKLQKSVFVSPFECKNEIDFIKHSYDIAPNVHYMLVKEIPDVNIREWFIPK